MGEFFCCSNTREVIDTKRIFLSNLSTFVCQNRFVLSLGFCSQCLVRARGKHVEKYLVALLCKTKDRCVRLIHQTNSKATELNRILHHRNVNKSLADKALRQVEMEDRSVIFRAILAAVFSSRAAATINNKLRPPKQIMQIRLRVD